MNPPIDAQNAFEDPRHRPDFREMFYPKANGREAPRPDATDRNERIVLEFLTAYYELNCEHCKLIEAREIVPSAERTAGEHLCLQAIEKVLIHRDALEDRYAPFGIIAEPLVKDGFTVDVKFTFGSVNAAGRLRGAPMISSATIPIRLPPGVKLENLTFPDNNPAANS